MVVQLGKEGSLIILSSIQLEAEYVCVCKKIVAFFFPHVTSVQMHVFVSHSGSSQSSLIPKSVCSEETTP